MNRHDYDYNYDDDRYRTDDRYEQGRFDGNGWQGLQYNGDFSPGGYAQPEPYVPGDQRIPVKLRKAHPDARIMTRGEGVKHLILMCILGVVFIAVGILVFIASIYSAERTHDFFDHAETVNGTVVSCTTKRTGSGRHKTTVYSVKYWYIYNSDSHRGSASLSRSEARSLDISTGSGGKEITVYVDTRNPSSSKIIRNGEQPAYFLLLISVLGVFMIVIGIINCKWCAEGKMVKYNVGKKIVMTKI